MYQTVQYKPKTCAHQYDSAQNSSTTLYCWHQFKRRNKYNTYEMKMYLGNGFYIQKNTYCWLHWIYIRECWDNQLKIISLPSTQMAPVRFTSLWQDNLKIVYSSNISDIKVIKFITITAHRHSWLDNKCYCRWR
jgi:hypothetical protein